MSFISFTYSVHLEHLEKPKEPTPANPFVLWCSLYRSVSIWFRGLFSVTLDGKKKNAQTRRILKFTYVFDVHSVHLPIYRRVYLYRQWSEKGLRVSIGLQNKRLALKLRNPHRLAPRQSSLALEYSLTHLALACLSIRYVMYPGSTLTSCLALLPSVVSHSSVSLRFFSAPSCVAATWPSHAGKENKGAALLRPNLHPYRTCVYTSENSLSRWIIHFVFRDFLRVFFRNFAFIDIKYIILHFVKC